ncbi:MAG: patatin-like phospholipase family protein [Planctomycetes bacterium]|nr:patatin-like phospholipase family protein [Planctomycetota bacterium]
MAKLALVLGGGGARGMAYIGVFRVLEEEGIFPDLLVGTSIGALAACMWSHSRDWRWVRQKTVDFLQNGRFRKYGAGLGLEMQDASPSFFRKCGIWARRLFAAPRFFLSRGLFSPDGLRDAVSDALPDVNLQDLPVPVAVVMLDLVSADEVVLTEGSCRDACVASANLAGFFPPVSDNGRLLVDCSSVASIPVLAARKLGSDRIVAVDIRSPIPAVSAPDIRNSLDAVLRLGVIASERANSSQVAAADVIISPDVGDVFWSDFRDMERLEAEGENAARRALPALRNLLR